MERPLVQILVEVANTRMKPSRAGEEKGSGASLNGPGLVDPKAPSAAQAERESG